METYIVGHTNNDTDSVVSAIVLGMLKQEMGKDWKACTSGPINKETKYVLETIDIEVPPLIPNEEKKVVLVDHNEVAQIPENVKVEEVIGIFDHHKLGGLATPGPISVTVRPFGSTSTIIAGSYKKKNLIPSEKAAKLMLAGIISDTLNFASPTTSDQDRTIADWLGNLAKMDVSEFADQMFKAKSDISDISTEDLVGKDYKVFDISGKKIGFGVWETVMPETIIARKEEILTKMREKKEKEQLDYIFFAAVDILKNDCEIFIIGDEEKQVAEAAFGSKESDELVYGSGIVSRKSQMIPPLEKYFSK